MRDMRGRKNPSTTPPQAFSRRSYARRCSPLHQNAWMSGLKSTIQVVAG